MLALEVSASLGQLKTEQKFLNLISLLKVIKILKLVKFFYYPKLFSTGVTSISVDHHKYGLAPKGVSIVLYKNKALRHYQYYASFSWPGGVYATPGAAGSRSGAPSAGAWFAMMYTGNNA